jgi:hypothetical protein
MSNYLDLKGYSGCITEPVTEAKEEILTKCKATLSLSIDKKLYAYIDISTNAERHEKFGSP